MRHFGFVPLSRLLLHTTAIVHHGGIGTCAQGLAAGVPHLVRPMSFDQFDNSRRLMRLGVAEEISVRKFHGPGVADALARLQGRRIVMTEPRKLTPLGFPLWVSRLQTQMVSTESWQTRIERAARELEAYAARAA